MSTIHAVGAGVTAYRSRVQCMDPRLIKIQDIVVERIEAGVFRKDDLIEMRGILNDYQKDHSDEQLNDIDKILEYGINA